MRVPAFVTRNFRLKLGCALLATITWVGVVYAGNPPETRVVSVHVPQAASLIPPKFVVQPVPDIALRIGGPRDSLDAFNTSSLTVGVNWRSLSQAGTVQVPITISNSDPNISLIDPPSTIQANADFLASVTAPINILVTNPPPQGYVIAAQASSPDSVVIAGPQHELSGLQARVTVDLGNQKTNFVRDSPVLIFDARGTPVTDVGLTPATVTVTITVGASQTSRSSAVVPRIVGSVAAGYQLVGLSVNPPAVVITGPQDLLNALDTVSTSSIALNGSNGNATVTVNVAPPPGVTASPTTVTVTLMVSPLPAATPTPTPTPAATPTP